MTLSFGIGRCLFFSALQTLGRFLSVCALLSLMGGHWAVLQITAWSIMIVERSSDRSVAEAVVETLSGTKPCSFCKAIQSGKKEEEKPRAFVRGDWKIELFSAARPPLLFAPLDEHAELRSVPLLVPSEWVIEPAVPVPILLS